MSSPPPTVRKRIAIGYDLPNAWNIRQENGNTFMTTPDELQSQRSALLHGCGLVRINRTRIEARGGDRASFLHNFCTNDIKRLQPGTGCEAFLTSVQGKTIGHAFFLAGEVRITIDTVADQGDFLFSHLDRYLITEDVELKDCSSDYQSFLISGSKVCEIAEESQLQLPAEFCHHADGSIGAKPVTIFRANFVSDSTYLISASTLDAPHVMEALIAAGATECGIDALTLARVENRFPEFGLDINDANLPQEVDRNDTAISFTKGCYLGQETVARLDALGHVNRVLRSVAINVSPDTPVPKPGDDIFVEEKKVGWFGTITDSTDPSTLLGLAYVKVQQAKPGTELKSNFGTLTVR